VHVFLSSFELGVVKPYARAYRDPGAVLAEVTRPKPRLLNPEEALETPILRTADALRNYVTATERLSDHQMQPSVRETHYGLFEDIPVEQIRAGFDS
jgi:hypothetical protein